MQGRKGNKTMNDFRLEKELVKTRLMDFIFDDEYARIEDKDAFYDEVAVEFRNNLNGNDNLEEALSFAIFSKLFKHIENKEIPENNYAPFQQRVCYEYTLQEDENEWVVLVVQRAMRLELTLCNKASNARYWVATKDITEIPDKKALLNFIEANMPKWINMWKTRCVGEVIAYDC